MKHGTVCTKTSVFLFWAHHQAPADFSPNNHLRLPRKYNNLPDWLRPHHRPTTPRTSSWRFSWHFWWCTITVHPKYTWIYCFVYEVQRTKMAVKSAKMTSLCYGMSAKHRARAQCLHFEDNGELRRQWSENIGSIFAMMGQCVETFSHDHRQVTTEEMKTMFFT